MSTKTKSLFSIFFVLRWNQRINLFTGISGLEGGKAFLRPAPIISHKNPGEKEFAGAAIEFELLPGC